MPFWTPQECPTCNLTVLDTRGMSWGGGGVEMVAWLHWEAPPFAFQKGVGRSSCRVKACMEVVKKGSQACNGSLRRLGHWLLEKWTRILPCHHVKVITKQQWRQGPKRPKKNRQETIVWFPKEMFLNSASGAKVTNHIVIFFYIFVIIILRPTILGSPCPSRFSNVCFPCTFKVTNLQLHKN